MRSSLISCVRILVTADSIVGWIQPTFRCGRNERLSLRVFYYRPHHFFANIIHWNMRTSSQLIIEPPLSSSTSSLEISPRVISAAILRPYTCAISPSIELAEFPGADLAVKVQHALARIVAELHLVGGWAADISANLSLIDSEPPQLQSPCSCSVNAHDLERLRRDVAQELRAELSKAEFTKLFQPTISDIKNEIHENDARLAALEKVTAQLQATLQTEQTALNRRAETGDSSLSLQVLEARREGQDMHRETREAQEKISVAMKILRLEMNEQREQTQRRLQLVARTINGLHSPTVPLVFSPRSSPPTDLYGVPTGQSVSGVRMDTGANAIEASDCFVYAKAALPTHRLDSKAREGAKSPVGRRVLTTRESHPIYSGDMEDALQVKAALLQPPLGYGEDDDQEFAEGVFDDEEGYLRDKHDSTSSAILPANHTERLHVQSNTINANPLPSNGDTGTRTKSFAVTSTTERRYHSSRLHSVPNAGYLNKSSSSQGSRPSLPSNSVPFNATAKPKPPGLRQ